MNDGFYNAIANSTAHRPIRDHLSELALQDKMLFHDLVAVALDVTDPYHYKACWILELVMEKEISWLADYLSQWCDSLQSYHHDGALRAIAKICLFAVTHHAKTNDFFSEKQLDQITEACFIWMIEKDKVATKAYAMRTLFLLGKKQAWIYPELKILLQQGFPNHTAAYKVAAKEILSKFK